MTAEWIPLIKGDGTPFSSNEIANASAQLGALDGQERERQRNINSSSLAKHSASRMLIVSGPGTGKSTFFKARIKHLLTEFPNQRVSVATFVRKLVRELSDDIKIDTSISPEEKKRVQISTLHSLARSILERNHGSNDLRLSERSLVVTDEWEDMVWEDAVSLNADVALADYPWEQLARHLYNADPLTDPTWLSVRSSHLIVEQFYNSLTYPDLIIFATRAASERPELVADVLFIIDEYQDFNRAEDQFIRVITNGSHSVLLVGDDDQVLYDQLRQAHAEIIRGYYTDPDFINAMLPFCGRCSFHITKNAEAFLEVDRPMESIEKVFLPLKSEPDGERVTVIASTTPKAGVSYIEKFLDDNAEAIKQRQEDLRNGTAKDPFLLILTPAREMKFLKPGGALDRLRSLIANFNSGQSKPPCKEYWKVRDYYYSAVRPTQNFNLRKILSYELVEQAVVTSLIQEALTRGKSLSELEHIAIKTALKKVETVRTIVEGKWSPVDQARAIAEIVKIEDVDALAEDLENAPIKGEPDSDADSPVLGRNEIVTSVDVTTIVGAKGLSADHVIVLGCDEVNLDRVTHSAFFVALTRARKSLTLMMCIGGGGATCLHRFVLTLPPEHTKVVYVKSGEMIEYPNIAELQAQLKRVQYAQNMNSRRFS